MPFSADAAGKRAAELLAATSGLRVEIARCFALVGPHLPLDAHFAAGNFLRDAAAGKPIVVRGDGTPIRSYLYASDRVIWLLTIRRDGRGDYPYNAGSDRPTTIAELAQLVADIAGGLPVEFLQNASAGAAERYLPDARRAQQEVGLGVLIGLSEAVRKTLAWIRSNSAAAPMAAADHRGRE